MTKCAPVAITEPGMIVPIMGDVPEDVPSRDRLADLATLYREHHGYVWRSLHHLGLTTDCIDDALQDVFIVVHRRLADYDGKTAMRSWLYGIARRIASEYRRGTRRAIRKLRIVANPDTRQANSREIPRVEAADMVERFLRTLDDDKREAFVLAELEGMTAPEIADALGVNVNTIYARLRAARLRFEREIDRQLARRQGRESWG